MGSFAISRRIDRWVQNEGLEEKEGLLNLVTRGTLVSMHTHGSKLKLTSSSLPLFAEGENQSIVPPGLGNEEGNEGSRQSFNEFRPILGQKLAASRPNPGGMNLVGEIIEGGIPHWKSVR